ncbi:MAG: metallophosphoesterase family protein [Tannerellaceae bacterium]
MKKIGILSDTHAYWDDRYAEYFAGCDEIWHAGDIGSVEVIEKLSKVATLRAVYGNIDGMPVKLLTAKTLRFRVEQTDVLLTHIGGYPGKYAPEIKDELLRDTPDLMVCGHSHILKVMFDKKLNMLHINPGAAGKYGFHKVRTLIRFVIDKEEMKDLEVIELA